MKLRFFCEQCGTEVPRNTVRCPSCGRYFTAIQCPQCGFRGSESDFAGGCPTCGYMRAGGVEVRKTASARRKGRRPGGRRRGASRVPGSVADGGGDAPAGPPLTVYKLMGIILLVLLGVLIAVLLLL